MNKTLDRQYIEKAMDYETYRKLVDDLLLEGKSTGPKQSESLTGYSKLNVTRMRRIDKTIQILPEVKEVLERITSRQTWLVITEGWCGDAAQVLPAIHALSKLNDKVELKLVLRDENLELMDQYLYKGKSRSIPKLIVANTDTLEVLFDWGARPAILQEKVEELKAQGVDYEQIKEVVHGWYAKDKTFETQREVADLISRV